MIFDYAISSGDDENEELECDARTLTSVNHWHKFRNAALGSHRLWSTQSYGNGKKAFKFFLERSGDAPLTIDLGINPPKWYMDEVLALGNRWGKVVVHQNMLGFMSQVREYGKRECAHQSYPRLKALEIFLSNGLHREDFDFTWHIPAIKSLICMNVIPTLSDESFASLTTLELTMDEGYVLDEILPQLQLMQNLQFLSLVIGDVDKSWDLDDYSDCDLKSLQSLHLTWSHVSVEDLDVFLDKINTENVKKVELNFLESFGDEISPEINCVFDSCDESKSHIRFPSLEDITIVAAHLENLDGLALEAGLLFDYPKIKNLHIQLPFIEPLDSHLMKNHQLDIKTIAIEGCLIGASEFLECLLSHVNPDGSRLCSGLTKLRVWGCAEVSRNFLMDYLPEEKIDFLPYEVPYFF